MIYTLIILFLGVSTLLCADPQTQNPMVTLDSIKVVLVSGENIEIITDSDTKRPGITGEIRNMDDLMLELLVYLDAQKHKIVPDDQAIDEYLMTIQRENNLTKDQLAQIFASAGYTFEDGRKMLRRIQAVNTMFDYKVRSNVLVPRKEIEAYYDEHPEYIEAKYCIVRAELPVKKDAKKEKTKVERAIAEKRSFDNVVEWSDFFWVKESDISQEKRAIIELQEGEVFLASQAESYFELFKLVKKEEKRLLTLDERYKDIANLLQRPRFEELLNKYKESLFETITVIRL